MLSTMTSDNSGTRPSRSALLAVLYADIAGSTRLYDKHGDTVAQKAITDCLKLLSDVVEGSGGRVVKSIGDEIQCVFEDPAEAMIAGTEMQPAIQQAGEDGLFATGPLRIKVGFHFGPTFDVDGEVHGEAAVIAQDIIQLAKPDQVLTSASTLDTIPNALRGHARHFDRIHLKGQGGTIDVYELIWDDISVTQEANFKPKAERARYSQVILSHNGQNFEVSEARPTLTIGRVKDNDIAISTDLTSRMHAEVHFRRGRVYITDVSVNGTLIIQDDGRTTPLRREHLALEGSGRICCGGTPHENPESVLTYECIGESN